eukprot:GGOE01043315.1.p2 GENE.GGOE01043315.1~~GGOE01043315.1.p2  ORF type:complete len:281 (+),score=87.27 GGOE01043315.1:54-896(+)
MGDDIDAEIRRILAAKDLYDTLGVPRTADEDELKRRYKRLALRCHPDKCNHPKAEEAFKAVGKAFSTLTDAQKRAQYDRYGEEGLQNPRAAQRRPGEVDPEDIYDIFSQMFGAEFSTAQRRSAQARRQRAQQGNDQFVHNSVQVFQLLPVLVFFLLYVLFNVGAGHNSAPYTLLIDQSNGYNVKRKTRDHQIPYYVKPSFASEYGNDAIRLQHLEDHVLESYKGYLSRRCKYEQREKLYMQQRAAMAYTGKYQQQMQEQADRYEMPSCDELRELVSHYGY